MTHVPLLIALGAAAALGGCILGYRLGKRRGRRLGEAQAALEDRRHLWETGRCRRCGAVFAEGHDPQGTDAEITRHRGDEQGAPSPEGS